MKDEYSFLRSQYLEIIDHCEYLLRNSGDPMVLSRANETKRTATEKLTSLNRAGGVRPGDKRIKTNA